MLAGVRFGVVAGVIAFASTLAANLAILVLRPADLCRVGPLSIILLNLDLPATGRRSRLRGRSRRWNGAIGGTRRSGGGGDQRLRRAGAHSVRPGNDAPADGTHYPVPGRWLIRWRRLVRLWDITATWLSDTAAGCIGPSAGCAYAATRSCRTCLSDHWDPIRRGLRDRPGRRRGRAGRLDWRRDQIAESP